MRRGPLPQPTELRELHGDPSGRGRAVRRAKIAAEPPEPTRADMQPPASLTPAQAALWRDLVASSAFGVLKRTDRSILRAFCVSACLHEEAAMALAKEGAMRGHVQSPWMSILSKQSLIMARLGEHLGLSPASRPRLAATAGAAPRAATAPAENRQKMSVAEYISNHPDRRIN